MKFRVVSVNSAGNDRVNVSFTQVNDNTTDGVVFAGGNLVINLATDEAKTYWPDQEYTLTLKAV